jgi:hypothetical protein
LAARGRKPGAAASARLDGSLFARPEFEGGVPPDHGERRLARLRDLMERRGELRTAKMFARVRGLSGEVRDDPGARGRRKVMDIVGDHAKKKTKRVVVVCVVVAGASQGGVFDRR